MNDEDAPVELQKNLDLERYQGLWYTAARIPKFFDRDTPWETAQYTLKHEYNDSDGENDGNEKVETYVEVHNTGYYEDGKIKDEIIGSAVVVDPREPAALKVSFPGYSFFQSLANIFGGKPEANYLVHRTDYKTYAIVGSYDKQALYLLVRQRPISREIYNRMLNYVKGLGYDITMLVEDYGAVDELAFE